MTDPRNCVVAVAEQAGQDVTIMTQGNSIEGAGGLFGMLGVRSLFGSGDDDVANRDELLGLPSGEPRTLGHGAAGPLLDPLPDVGAGPLLALEVPGEGGREDPELPRGFGLCESTLLALGEKRQEQVGGGAVAHGARFRFMNHALGAVKTGVSIHDCERARMAPMPKRKSPGKERDDAVAWYCHMRFKKMIEDGARQNELAEAAKVPPSAINHLIKNAGGVGLTTARAFVSLFGFETRGQLVDAADEWYGTAEAGRYIVRETRVMNEEKLAKTEAKLQKERERNEELKRAAEDRRVALKPA